MKEREERRRVERSDERSEEEEVAEVQVEEEVKKWKKKWKLLKWKWKKKWKLLKWKRKWKSERERGPDVEIKPSRMLSVRIHRTRVSERYTSVIQIWVSRIRRND
ncbi:hypothetical protein F2P79_024266 [Pimephales promelas]|nr:hypothetical protein F2P79_024266 [Pimephales promelas]